MEQDYLSIIFPNDGKCAIRDILDPMNNKWCLLIVIALKDGPHRFTQLQHRLEGISRRMLTESLRRLERNGFVNREYFQETPPRVVYTLTDRGQRFAELNIELVKWALDHRDAIAESRREYDEAQMS